MKEWDLEGLNNLPQIPHLTTDGARVGMCVALFQNIKNNFVSHWKEQANKQKSLLAKGQ